MLKKLLYLYNDGHNPFPHLKGDGLHLINGQYEYDNEPNDENVYDQGFITGNYTRLDDGRFLMFTDDGDVQEFTRENTITAPDYYKHSTPVEEEDLYDDELFGNEEDEELEDINDQIEKIKILAKKNLGDEFKTIKDIQEKNKIIVKELDILNENVSEFKKNLVKLGMKIIKESKDKMDEAHVELSKSDIYEHVMSKISQKFVDMNDYEMNNEKIKNEISKYVKMMKTDYETLIYGVTYALIQVSKKFPDQDIKDSAREKASIILLSISKDSEKSNTILNNILKAKQEFTDKHNIHEKFVDQLEKFNMYFEQVEYLKKQYADRKKLLDQKNRLGHKKELKEIDPEQAAKDKLEIEKELKKKEALAQGKQLSKAAQKKANAEAKKAAAEKQAQAPVTNALAALETKGTYGKKLETFFTQNGEPILQQLTGDTSKIHDIERQTIIPDENVIFDDKTENSLRKACTLDLYNDKFVFEIKNYLNISIYDKNPIPMQPSKFAGTKYFIPTYFEDGSLYKLNLKYDSPITGKQHRQNVLPDSSDGREVVFIIRLKEGLYYYRPFIDTENNKLIPNGEYASGKPLYFFDYTKLKKCKDFKGKDAFNLRGHLTPI
jgi:hypothetical protein